MQVITYNNIIRVKIVVIYFILIYIEYANEQQYKVFWNCVIQYVQQYVRELQNKM